MHPAISLLIYVVITIHIALPLGTWLLAARRHEPPPACDSSGLEVKSDAMRTRAKEHDQLLMLNVCVAWQGQ